MTTKILRLSDSLLDAVHELGNAEHIEEATAMRKLLRLGSLLSKINPFWTSSADFISFQGCYK